MENSLVYTYQFDFEDGPQKNFSLELDPSTLEYLAEEPDELPDWTALEHHQCPNCPLSADEHPHCPVAVNMVGILEYFRDFFSYDKADVTIKANDRYYHKESAVQDALSSLLGIIMTTSGCPVLDKLRPMVRIHLPFSTTRENLYRAISMYFTAQFFKAKNNNDGDSWELDGLVEIYEEIETVNEAFCKRIATSFDKDANVNAIVILNCMAEIAALSIKQDLLEDIEKSFAAYLD